MCIRPWFYDQHSAVSRPGDSAPYNSALKELLVRLTGFVRLDGRTSVPRGRQYWPKSVGLPARGRVSGGSCVVGRLLSVIHAGALRCTGEWWQLRCRTFTLCDL